MQSIRTNKKSSTNADFFSVIGPESRGISICKKYYNPVIYRCVKLIAQNTSMIRVVVDDAKNGATHIQRLFDSPNFEQDYVSFIEKVVYLMMIKGSVYIMGMGTLAKREQYLDGIQAVSPDSIEIEYDKAGNKIGYIYKKDNETKKFPIEKNGECRLLQIKYSSPFDGSTYQIAKPFLDLYEDIVEHNHALIINSPRMPGALVTKERLSSDEGQRIRREIDEKIKGLSNTGFVPILSGGMSWEDFTKSKKEMDFLDSIKLISQIILNIFGINPIIMGISESGAYHMYEHARRHLFEDTVLPLATKIILSIERWLNCLYSSKGITVRLKLDLQEIPAFAEKRMQMIEVLKNADFISEQEKRAMCGLYREKEVNAKSKANNI